MDLFAFRRIALFTTVLLTLVGTIAALPALAQEDAPAKMKPGDPKLNLNTTPTDAFLVVPDVGRRMAHEFDEYRPYVSIVQFRKEIGKYVDADQVAAFEQFVFVPIDFDECDAETLQQIPGVTADIAKTLLAGRPYDSNEAFLKALSGHVSGDELAIAETYLVED